MSEIDAIIRAKAEFVRRNPGKTPRININPQMISQIWKEKDERGYYYWQCNLREDPPLFGSICGMKAVRDSTVEGWEIF